MIRTREPRAFRTRMIELSTSPSALKIRIGREPSCLVAERCWDRVRWAIEEYTWRFDGLRRRVPHPRRT